MKKCAFGLAIAFALMGCTAKQSGEPLEYWRNHSPNNLDKVQVSQEQGLLVVYRENDVQGNAVNVYINGDYQSSLLKNAFTPVVLCAGSQKVSLSYSTNKGFGNRTSGQSIQLAANSTTYVKLSQRGGMLSAEVVPANIAKAVVDKLPQENQTVSRVVSKKGCAAEIKPLSASFTGLFKFDTSSVVNMNSKDGKRLAEFAENVKAYDQANIEYLTVSGYTDPEGSVAYNQNLSDLRAQAVANKLRELNVTKPIKAAGYGSQDLVVTDCAAKHKDLKERRVCNYPNRRVEVKVYGR